MKNIIKILFLILTILLVSCSKEEKISVIEEENIEAQMIEAFKEGYEELEKGDVLFAVKKLKKMNLAKGGTLENAVVVEGQKILNKNGLRNKKEFVNHKILDCIGDLYLSGYKIIGKLTCSQGGHKLTNQLLRRIFADNANFSLVEVKEKNIPHSLINKNILKSIA